MERLTGKFVLADAGPLYAAIDPSDQFFGRAVSEAITLVDAGFSVAVAYPTLHEVHGLALYRLGYRAAIRFLREAEERMTFLAPSDSHYRTAIARLVRYPDQNLSLSDAVVGVISDRLRLPVWTYDHHFDVMRTSVWRP